MRFLLRRGLAFSLTGRFSRNYWSQPNHKPCFEVGDHVLLRQVRDPTRTIFVKQPLDPSGTIQSPRGFLYHASIIGKQVRDVVKTNRGEPYRLHQPTLEEYVVSSSRKVTPIYPGDASTIASLLDIDVHSRMSSEDDVNGPASALRILEAGTGHGGLTLHLARAIHAANGSPPILPASETAGSTGQELGAGQFEEFRRSRRAVIETVEANAVTARHALKLLRQYRQGLYYADVDVHIGPLDEYLTHRLQSSLAESPFAHAILDLPGASTYLGSVAAQLATDGKLIVYNPSITQIAECVQAVAEQKLPLELDRVVELGRGVSGGREWDVRLAAIRAVAREREREAQQSKIVEARDELAEVGDDEGSSRSHSINDDSVTEGPAIPHDQVPPAAIEAVDFSSPSASAVGPQVKQYGMVCRPRAGQAVVVSGFVGVWRKKAAHEMV